MFPNPSQNTIHLEGMVFDYAILFDLQGRQVVKTSSKTVDIKMLNRGSYTLHL